MYTSPIDTSRLRLRLGAALRLDSEVVLTEVVMPGSTVVMVVSLSFRWTYMYVTELVLVVEDVVDGNGRVLLVVVDGNAVD